MRVTSLLTAASVLFLAGAHVPAQQEQPETRPATRPSVETIPETQFTVKLLKPGAEPRRPLRYQVSEKASETQTAVTNISSETKMDGNPMPAPERPPVKVSASLQASAAEQGGGPISYEMEITDAGLAGEAESAMDTNIAESLGTLAGTRVQGTMTSRGHIGKTRVHLPAKDKPAAGLLANIQEFLTQFSVLLPEEPVGKGARWRTTRTFTSFGVRQTIEETITLKSLEGDTLELESSISYSAPEQDFAPPGMPAGGEARLTSLKGTGSRTRTVDLTRLTPLRASGKATITMEMLLTAGPREVEMTNTSTQELSVEGR